MKNQQRRQAGQGRGFLVGVAAACLVSGGSAALAGGDRHGGADAEMKMMDSNGDAKVSAEEHSAGARQMFATMDADKDGKVTAVEMEAARGKVMGKHDEKAHKEHPASDDGKARPHKMMGMSAAEKIKVVDSNGDGALSAGEHEAGAKTMFTKMDSNGDGLLTKDEIAQGHKQLMKSHHKDKAASK